MRKTALIVGAGLLVLLVLVLSSSQHPVVMSMPGWGSGGGPGSLSQPYTEVRGFAARSTSDIWAVGIGRGPREDQGRIAHWNGAQWTAIAPRSAGGHPDALNGVAEINPSDVWVVGFSGGVGGLDEATLVQRWDGSNWTTMPTPNPALFRNELDGVAALSATDVWAVGYYKDDAAPARALVEHWTGSAWRLIDAPSPGKYWNQLAAVTATGPDDIWAVGWQQSDGPFEPLIEHWDGKVWSLVASAPDLRKGELRSVVAITPSVVWAAGSELNQMVERWDGIRWVSTDAPTRSQGAEIWSIGASSATDAWLVGGRVGRGYGVLLEHWDGSRWKVIDSPGGIGLGRLTAVLPLSGHDVWIAGTRQSNQPLTLIEHWDGQSWSVVDWPDAP